LIKLFDTNELKKKFITYARDEGYSFNIIISALKSTISCDVLGSKESFLRTCFGHAFLKTCQYSIIDEKNCKGLKSIFIKVA